MSLSKTPSRLHQLELVVEQSPDFIGISDAAGKPLLANPAALELIGVTWEVMLEKSILDFLVPEEREFGRTVILKALLKEARWEGELTLQNLKTGASVPVLSQIFQVEDDFPGAPAQFAMIARDLRERKRREAELEDALQRVASVLAATEVATWTYEIAPNRVVADANLSRLFGVSPEEAAGGRLESYLRAIHPDDRLRVQATIAEAIQRDGHFISEYRLVQIDGSVRTVLARGSVERDSTGRALRMPGVILDITDRVQAENERLELSAELARQGRTMETLLSSIADFAYIFDRNGRFVYANKALLSLWGLKLEEAIGKNFFDLHYPEELATKLQEQIQKVFQTKKPLSDKTPYTSPSGAGGYYEYIFWPVLDSEGFVEQVAGSTREITESQNTLEALQRSEENFRTLAETLPDTVWATDSAGRLLWTNSVLPRATSQSLEMIRGEEYSALVHPEDVAVTKAAWDLGKESGNTIEFQHRMRMSDGTWRWHLVRGAPARDAKGRIYRWIGTSTDIHDQRELQDKLERMAHEREELLASERAARSTAEHASRMKDEFLATLSHELRTPLNAIFGWTRILREQGGTDAATLAEGVEVIDRNVRMQTQLIEDLLDMSRIISGKLRLDVQEVNVTLCIKAAIETVQPSAEAKDIQFETSLDPLAGFISGDAGRIQQIVWNLLSNAIKFTPRGGKVEVLLQRVGSYLEIKVTDSGQGIDPDFLPFVFDRFRQADAAANRQHRGLGLGLSIVKQLVELHGGSIQAKSAGRSKGSAFLVHLPLKLMQPEIDEGGPLNQQTPFSPAYCKSSSLLGLRVLVVDDERDARDLLKRVLEDSGAVVSTAGSATEALPLIGSMPPDVLVTDIGMPEVDGYEFLKMVSALGPNWRKIPAVALTAFTRPEDRTKALLAGFKAHVAKPTEPVELILTIATVSGRIDAVVGEVRDRAL
jgi:PAS domain S-box-containing protein